MCQWTVYYGSGGHEHGLELESYAALLRTEHLWSLFAGAMRTVALLPLRGLRARSRSSCRG